MVETVANEGRCYQWDDQTELPESFGEVEFKKKVGEVSEYLLICAVREAGDLRQ